ncbi:Hypp1394 [Branchiostoma lanceolatum]|uniref:Hypp1394 protein n=1 Tax=Branchiostoma lanceolatum TaxID=7740 RepID=A0A8J9ZIT4_BRALA|nr:Hypp1394 [Branchiostoma lanceolatum]
MTNAITYNMSEVESTPRNFMLTQTTFLFVTKETTSYAFYLLFQNAASTDTDLSPQHPPPVPAEPPVPYSTDVPSSVGDADVVTDILNKVVEKVVAEIELNITTGFRLNGRNIART